MSVAGSGVRAFNARQELLFKKALVASVDFIKNFDEVNITSVREATRRRMDAEDGRGRALATAVYSKLEVSYSVKVVSPQVDTKILSEEVNTKLMQVFNVTSTSNGTSSFQQALVEQAAELKIKLNCSVDTEDTVNTLVLSGATIVVGNLVTFDPTPAPTPVPTLYPTFLPTLVPSSLPTQEPTVTQFGDISIEQVEAVATATAVAVGAAVGSSVGASVGASVSTSVATSVSSSVGTSGEFFFRGAACSKSGCLFICLVVFYSP